MYDLDLTSPTSIRLVGVRLEPKQQEAAAREAFSVVIPAYNECRGIGPTLDDLLSNLKSLQGIDHEVIVVDDGSTDDTAQVVARYQEHGVRLVSLERNRGYGAAIKIGTLVARHPWILITDADGTYPNKHIPELLSQRAGADMVVGARRGNDPLLRRFPKLLLRKFASYLSRTAIPDLNSGMRVMRREAVLRYASLLPNGFSLTTTITLAMLSGPYGVTFTPIDYLKRTGKSHIRPIHDTMAFATVIVRTTMFFHPLRVLGPIGIALMVAGAAVGLGSYTISGVLADVTTVLLTLAGMQSLALGLLGEAVVRRTER